LPSLLSIAVTYAVLWFMQRDSLKQEVVADDVNVPRLSRGGRTTACGIVGTGIVLLLVSGFDVALGLPTFVAGVATAKLVLLLTPPLAVDPELVEPFAAALNADDAIAELRLDILLPQLARLDNMTVSVDYTGH
jgi:Na+/H+ antiporter NhaD/arsenite permease-like protein